MKALYFLAAGCIVSVGCGAKPAPADSPSNLTTSSASGRGGGSSNGDSVTPIGPNIGPMTPVGGGENLGEGTGGGLGQRAKDMARNAASQSSHGEASPGDDTGQ